MPRTLGFPKGAHSGARGAVQEDAGLGALLAPGCREAAKEPGSLCGQLLLTAPSGRAAGGGQELPGSFPVPCALAASWGFGTAVCRV